MRGEPTARVGGDSWCVFILCTALTRSSSSLLPSLAAQRGALLGAGRGGEGMLLPAASGAALLGGGGALLRKLLFVCSLDCCSLPCCSPPCCSLPCCPPPCCSLPCRTLPSGCLPCKAEFPTLPCPASSGPPMLCTLSPGPPTLCTLCSLAEPSWSSSSSLSGLDPRRPQECAFAGMLTAPHAEYCLQSKDWGLEERNLSRPCLVQL